MFDALGVWFAKRSLGFKNSLSLWIDARSRAKKAIVRQFATPRGAWEWMHARFSYKPDPAGGRFDFYTHPQALQWALDAGPQYVAKLYRDCDDWAIWLAEATRHIPGATVETWMLLGRGMRGNHQITVARLADGTCWGYDITGCYQLPDLAIATVCAKWSEVYAADGFVYFDAFPTSHPWA